MTNIKIGDGFKIDKTKVANPYWSHISHCTIAIFKVIHIDLVLSLSCSCCQYEAMADLDDIGIIYIPSKYIVIKKTEYQNTDI